MKFYAYFLLTFLPSVVFSQSTKPAIAKEPAWITKNVIDYSKISLDNEATDGYVDIAYETQVSLAEQTEYVRRSKKIISQAGIQNGSQVSVDFDPSYQQLFFNSIRIIRNGEILNKLQLNAIKTVQQEKELDDFIYNGTLNSILILDDVRQGDIIEYSYFIKGFNPIFKKKYSEKFRLNYSVPIYDLYYKLIVPADRKINIKNLNHNLQPTIHPENGAKIYEWHKNNIGPLVTQDYLPTWYNPYAEILVSEFNSWKEVSDWAMELFPLKKELSQAVLKKVKEIEAAYTSVEDRTHATLQFVQDDIRYMGIEMGVNSHKPTDPSKVFIQRFGDCKEKSYLLCVMLHAMGITANVVLINTDDKKEINNWLPAPTNFDHATVRIKLGNAYYWFDPTIAYQRGNIKDLFYPNYEVGLVIADSTTGLTNIPAHQVSYQHVQELFTVGAMYGSGTLKVTTNFKGHDADNVRNDFNTESNSELMTSYQKFYSAYYDGIKADSVTHNDDDSTGIFTTNEFYTIPRFWTVEKDNVDKFSISPFVIDANFIRPKEKDRKMPFKMAFPSNFQEEIIVDLPTDWNVTESETHVKNANFAFNSKFYCEYNRVHLLTDYESFKDHITADEASQYFEDYKKYDAGADFEITSGKKDAESKQSSSTKDKIIVLLLIIIVVGGLIWWSQSKGNRY